MAKYLNNPGLWEIITHIVKGDNVLKGAVSALERLREGVGKIANRVRVNTMALRVLDIEVMERDAQIWERIKTIEEATFGGSLDDYLQKKAYLTTEELDAVIAAVKAKDAALLPEGIEDKYLNGTGLAYVLANIDTITPYLNVTPEDIQWISQAITAQYSVKSNRDWEVG